MEKYFNKTGIFSGRFDPPHLGHLITILNLCRRFNRIVVVVLDYPERKICGAEEVRRIFKTCFEAMLSPMTIQKVFIDINKIHFGQITFVEYSNYLNGIGVCFAHSIYLSGNKNVLANIDKQGIPWLFVPRTEDWLFSGCEVRKEIDNKLNAVYGVDVDDKIREERNVGKSYGSFFGFKK